VATKAKTKEMMATGKMSLANGSLGMRLIR
jgi:hypothetical protein